MVLSTSCMGGRLSPFRECVESAGELTSFTMIEEHARRLDQALLARREIPPLTISYGDFDLETAYRIQEQGVALRLERGEKIVGYKMGLTSAAKRAQMNLGSPIYGVLTGAMRADGTLRAADGIHPKIEPEIAFITARELRGNISRDEALKACSGVAPAMDVLDSRFVGFKLFSLPDVVADNCSSWRFVLGEPTKPRDVALRRGGAEKAARRGRAARAHERGRRPQAGGRLQRHLRPSSGVARAARRHAECARPRAARGQHRAGRSGHGRRAAAARDARRPRGGTPGRPLLGCDIDLRRAPWEHGRA